MEDVVMKSLQLFIDMWVDSRKIVDMEREKQEQRLALAEKHLLDMEKSYERINKDLRDAWVNRRCGQNPEPNRRCPHNVYARTNDSCCRNIYAVT